MVRVILENSILEKISSPVTSYERNLYTFCLERLEINSAVWSVKISKLWLLIILPTSVRSSSRLSACVWCISVSFLKYQHFRKLWKWRISDFIITIVTKKCAKRSTILGQYPCIIPRKNNLNITEKVPIIIFSWKLLQQTFYEGNRLFVRNFQRYWRGSWEVWSECVGGGRFGWTDWRETQNIWRMQNTFFGNLLQGDIQYKYTSGRGLDDSWIFAKVDHDYKKFLIDLFRSIILNPAA